MDRKRKGLIDKAMAINVPAPLVSWLAQRIEVEGLDAHAAIAAAKEMNVEALTNYAQVRKQVLDMAMTSEAVDKMATELAEGAAAAESETSRIEWASTRRLFRAWLRVEGAAIQCQPFDAAPTASIENGST